MDTRTPRELKGSIRDENGSNKTQAVAIKLIQRLPNKRKGTYVFVDNLFISTKFALYLKSLSVEVTGTARIKSGIMKRLIDIKKSDKDNYIPWGTMESGYTMNGLLCHMAWKDNVVAFLISTI